MEYNKTPCPGGILAEFCQWFWDLVKFDLMNMLEEFHRDILDIQRLNYEVITLLPKCNDAAQIQKFRSICLLNVSFKILMNRLSKVANSIISSNQTTFIKKKNRYNMGGVLVLHETLNTLHKEKKIWNLV